MTSSEQVRIPPTSFHLGLQSKVKCRSTEYLGGIHQGLCALLDHCHIRILNDETSSTTVIPGALPLPSIETLLGNGSFDSGNPTPWSTLLSHEDLPLAIGLKAAWTDIQSHLNDTVINTPQLAILQRPIEAAGTDTNGSFPHSVTAAVSKCLDFLAYEQLPQLNHSVKAKIFTQYLGLPSPSCEPLAGGYIGKHPPIRYLEEASQLLMTTIRTH
jgi:hypothetical protein